MSLAVKRPGGCGALRANRGLSLVELLVVLAVGAVLAAVALPDYRRYLDRQELERETDRLVAEINRAKLKAMQEGRSWRIHFDAERDCYRITPNGGASLERCLADNVSFGSPTSRDYAGALIPASGVRFGTNSQLTFSAMGTCNSGTVFLTAGGRAAALSLQPACGLAVLRLYDGGWHAE